MTMMASGDSRHSRIGLRAGSPVLALLWSCEASGFYRGVVVEAAAEQSHRGRIPEVTAPMTLPEALGLVAGTPLVILDPLATEPVRRRQNAVALAVGPEGGWTDDEMAAMVATGATRATLGPRILRARLAPVAAAVILSSAT